MSRFSTFRVLISAALISAALIASTAAQVLAGPGSGPFPK